MHKRQFVWENASEPSFEVVCKIKSAPVLALVNQSLVFNAASRVMLLEIEGNIDEDFETDFVAYCDKVGVKRPAYYVVLNEATGIVTHKIPEQSVFQRVLDLFNPFG